MVTEDYPDPTVVPMCATAIGVNGLPLYDRDIALTSTGVGVLTDDIGSTDLGTALTGTIQDDGHVSLFIMSTVSGDQVLSASIGGLNKTATETWIPGRAFGVSVLGLNGKTSEIEGSQLQVVATVVDVYGNAVPLVHVDWTATVPGIIMARAGGQGWTDATGRASAIVLSNEAGTSDVTATILKDAYPGPEKDLEGDVTLTWMVPTPSMTAPTAVFQKSRSIKVSWGAVAAAASFNVEIRSAKFDGSLGSWTPLQSGVTGTSITANGKRGFTHCFHVQALDGTGAMSASSSQRCTAIPLDDRALTRKGAWKAGTGDAYYAGTYLRSSKEGAKLVLPGVHAKRIAIMVDKVSKGGTVQVWFKGTKVATINTAGSGKRVLVNVMTSSSVATGKLVIKVVSSGKSVFIDGVGISQA